MLQALEVAQALRLSDNGVHVFNTIDDFTKERARDQGRRPRQAMTTAPVKPINSIALNSGSISPLSAVVIVIGSVLPMEHTCQFSVVSVP
jgi:hypothetical protein